MERGGAIVVIGANKNRFVVSPYGDDFGPFTAGTTTDGLQEALTEAGDGGTVLVRSGTYKLKTNVAQKGNNQGLFCEPGVTFLADSAYAPAFGVVGMFSLGQDGVNDYDGFIFEGSGCLLDGQNFASTAGLFVTGRSREVFRFSLRNFRVQNCADYGLAVGRVLNVFPGSIAGFVIAENFDLYNCGWIRIWASEHVLVRNGRCRRIPATNLNGWFITAQHSGTGNLVCRDVVCEDLYGNSNTADVGGTTGDDAIEVQASAAATNTDVTRDVVFRRCILRTNAAAPAGSGGVYLDDATINSGPATLESLAFVDCTFDGPVGSRDVGNTSDGFVMYDHCEFIGSAALPTTTFRAGTVANRPVIVRRPASGVTYPNQNFTLTSPVTNTHRYVMVVVVSGASSITFTPRGGTAIATGVTSGVFFLSTGDQLTASGTPTITAAPWF